MSKSYAANKPPPPPNYRPDIDGLRAIAVLSVVAYHAFPAWIKGGFVGVDIFFVISGFLISSIILTGLEHGSFSFSHFYSRRIRRIFPALLVVLIACYAVGWQTLLADEYKQLGKHIVAGAGFVSNLVLWRESGYFDVAAELKPLLHLWSLGIEEQFYIFWPLILWAAWKRKFNLFWVTVALATLSLSFNLTTYRVDWVANFYSPLTRFWELLAGAWLAHWSLYPNLSAHPRLVFLQKLRAQIDAFLATLFFKNQAPTPGVALANVQSALGLLCIAASLILITKDKAFPGTWALLPVFGAILGLAAGPQAFFNRTVLSSRLFVWFGLISYPLYLWHWPILSFARIMESATPSRSLRIAAVLAAIALAWLTMKLVERPLRFGGRSKVKVTFLVGMMLLTGFVGHNTYRRDGLFFRAIIRNLPQMALLTFVPDNNALIFCKKTFGESYAKCQQVKDSPPTVAIIGDSHAAHFYPGLAAEYERRGENLVVLSQGHCPPLLEITSSEEEKGNTCTSPSSSDALKKVAAMASIHTVILAARWHKYIIGKGMIGREFTKIRVIGNEHLTTNQAVFEAQMRETVNFLKAAGKKVVVIKQIPENDLVIRECVVSPSKRARCQMSEATVKTYLADYETLFDAVVIPSADIKVLDPYSIFCEEGVCKMMADDLPLYGDYNHLSPYGSNYVARRLPLFD